MQIVNNNKLFDRRDNTFLLSNRKMAGKLKVGSSTVDRLFRVLKKHELVRIVRNQSYTKGGKESKESKTLVVMLSPKFLFISYTKSDRWMIGALWELRDLREVYQWGKLCRELNCYISPATGELKPFNWWMIDCKANQYTCFDRCYRKKSKEVHHSDDESNTQYYSLKDSEIEELTQYDRQWLSSINNQSTFNYRGVNYV
ncbi:hypothetical protein VPH5P1C_0154 [Vibrio phage 5P1c]